MGYFIRILLGHILLLLGTKFLLVIVLFDSLAENVKSLAIDWLLRDMLRHPYDVWGFRSLEPFFLHKYSHLFWFLRHFRLNLDHLGISLHKG